MRKDKKSKQQEVTPGSKVTKSASETKSQMRTFPNGLIVEELEMGKPNGKQATAGKKVSRFN